MKKKLMMRMVPAFMFFLLCSGCGMEENIVINPDLSSSITLKSYTTDEEEVMISQELEGVTYQQMMEGAGFVSAGKEELYSEEHNVYQLVMNRSAAETAKDFSVVNNSQAVMWAGELAEMQEQFEEYTQDDFADDDLDGYVYTSDGIRVLQNDLNITCPFVVAVTNGDVMEDGRTVQFCLDELEDYERLFAVGSKRVARIRTCTISGVEDGGFYRKDKVVKATSDGVIISFSVNGESLPVNEYRAVREGTYRVRVKMLSGATRKVKFTIDKTKPTTNIRSKKYKKKVKITFRDENSGVKKAVLDGKKIKNGTVVTKKGSHVLKITDKAGNVKTVRFSIRK